MAILGEVFSIIRNGASIKQIDGANGFPITRIETISNRVIDRNRLGYANVFDITEYESYVLQSGDILMSHINSEKHLGKTALYIKKGNEKIIHGMNLLMLRANSEVILPLYAKYFFDSNLFLKQIPNITKKSVNQASFTVTALKKLEIKIPKMVEQKRIIDIMSRLDNIIQYRKDQLEKLDLFVKSRFIEMFGDPLNNSQSLNSMPMTDVCYIIDGDRGKNYPTANDFYEVEHCLFLNAKNVTSNGFSFDSCMFITKEKDQSLRKGKLKRGDVVLTTRGTLGNLAYYTDDVPYENIRINSGMVILRMHKSTVNEVFFIEQFKMLLDDIKAKIASGSAQPQLPISTMNKIVMIIPEISEQNQFADFVAQVDKSKLAIQQSLDELETLKKSLMQQYFG